MKTSLKPGRKLINISRQTRLRISMIVFYISHCNMMKN